MLSVKGPEPIRLSICWSPRAVRSLMGSLACGLRWLSRPLSRSYLLESIWGQSPEAETRTLDAHVSRIRSKLNLRAENGYRVLPVYSYGYRLEPTNANALAEEALSA